VIGISIVAAQAGPLSGRNLRDMLVSLGYDIDCPWRSLPRKDRDWILFTEEQPVVSVYIGDDADETRRALERKEEPSYHGNFSSARRYVLQTRRS
jgi:excinuclease ABC subunit A